MVDLKDMKEYLRVDYEDDDKLIQDLIKETEIYIDSCVGKKYRGTDEEKLADILLRKIVKNLYDDKSLYLDTKKVKYDRISSTILDILSNCDGDNNE